MRKSAALVALCLALIPAVAHAVVPSVEQPIAELRALDKMTARVEVLDVPINKPTSFGDLIITARTCRVTLPEETTESAAYLEVGELKPGAPDTPVFHGWMFASSPALSAMEHPIYDLWLIGCKDPHAAVAPAAPPTAEATPPLSPGSMPTPPAKKK
jgi:hypothetical protein